MNDAPAPASNIPEYTVSEIAGAVKRTLEGTFARVRVRGEITEFKRYPSGHVYFCLKDEAAKIRGVVWRSAVARLGMVPEDGIEVIATGRLSSYPERSEYQLVVERLEYAGAGALLAKIELLRQRLAAEGLFDDARKRRLPLLPRVVGVVTSERGAVLHDILTTIERRCPRPVLLWPVPVQGEGAAARIAAAIRGFGALPDRGSAARAAYDYRGSEARAAYDYRGSEARAAYDSTSADSTPAPRPDVLIVARGGGSLEDLMAFNDEEVVRAAAASPIPLISAVGHETDTTLIDYAADRRAPTPTAAAELAVPVRADLIADLQHKTARMTGALNRILQEHRLRLGRARHGLPDLPSLIGGARQRLDDRLARLLLALPNLIAAKRAALVRVERDVPDPRALIASRRAGLMLQSAQLRGALRHAVAARRAAAQQVFVRAGDAPLRARLREARARLEGLAARLESVSHRAVLARGYALVFDAGGRPLTRAEQVRPGARVKLRFADGEVGARADAGTSANPGTRTQGKLPL